MYDHFFISTKYGEDLNMSSPGKVFFLFYKKIYLEKFHTKDLGRKKDFFFTSIRFLKFFCEMIQQYLQLQYMSHISIELYSEG